MKYTPTGTRVLLELVEPEKQPGLIIVPDHAIPESYGRVIAVGEGYITDVGFVPLPDLEIGQVVLFPKSKAQFVIMDGQKLILINYSDILLKILN